MATNNFSDTNGLKKCPVCNAETSAESGFCTNCGADLAANDNYQQNGDYQMNDNYQQNGDYQMNDNYQQNADDKENAAGKNQPAQAPDADGASEVTQADIDAFSMQIKNIFSEIRRDVVGQKEVVEGTVIAMIAGGNVLLEGVPGVGKTRLVRTLGRVFDLPFSRIQFTPDLMPADVTGTNIIVKDDNGNSTFAFQPGPVFSNIILADEINRATPKTQSALLEAMQEHTVTVMGTSRKLSEPFFVLATQNPIEQDGTYPLPEAQMDRFMFKLIVPNPSLSELMDIVTMTQKTMAEVSDRACTGEELLRMRHTASKIPVARQVMEYAMILTSATHPDSECATETAKKYVRLGASPRAGQALISAAKVLALIKGRYNVAYSDINELAHFVLRHRIKLNFEAVAERITTDNVIDMILEELAKKLKVGTVNTLTPDAEAEEASDNKKDHKAKDRKSKIKF